MTDAPLSTKYDPNNGDGNWPFILLVVGVPVDTPMGDTYTRIEAQLAAAARVPKLQAEIEYLTAQRNFARRRLTEVRGGAFNLRAENSRLATENADLRARLAAAPDLTELRELAANRRYYPWLFVHAVDRLLAAVPSTGTDGGGECCQRCWHGGGMHSGGCGPCTCPPVGTDGGAA